MSQTVNPLLYPDQWNHILLANQKSPGVCVVSAPKRKKVWDKKRGKGAKGATLTYQGFEAAEFTVTFKLWRYPGVTGPNDPDDFGDWDAFVPLLQTDPSTDPAQSALDIYHPLLVGPGIKSVVVEDFTGPEPKGSNLYEAVVSFVEYAPPPATNASATPLGSAGDIQTDVRTVAPPPLTAEQLLAQLQAQAQSPTG